MAVTFHFCLQEGVSVVLVFSLSNESGKLYCNKYITDKVFNLNQCDTSVNWLLVKLLEGETAGFI